LAQVRSEFNSALFRRGEFTGLQDVLGVVDKPVEGQVNECTCPYWLGRPAAKENEIAGDVSHVIYQKRWAGGETGRKASDPYHARPLMNFAHIGIEALPTTRI
jgi:hypothetical protein